MGSKTNRRAAMPTAELTLKLPAEEIEFLQSYAQEHGMTAAELVGVYVKRLKDRGDKTLHPDIVSLTGLVPPDIDAVAEYRQYLSNKHK